MSSHLNARQAGVQLVKVSRVVLVWGSIKRTDVKLCSSRNLDMHPYHLTMCINFKLFRFTTDELLRDHDEDTATCSVDSVFSIDFKALGNMAVDWCWLFNHDSVPRIMSACVDSNMFSSWGLFSTIEWQFTIRTLIGMSFLCLWLHWTIVGSSLSFRLG